jgi:dihydroxyacetone kinase
MTKLFNDPAVFMDEMLQGFFDIYPQYVTSVPGGMVRSEGSDNSKVSVVVGGGSGHYPAFYGVVGRGFADGAVVGNVFTSPSTQDVFNVAKAADNGGGVLLITGNYAGDVLNFKQAQDKLIEVGIPTQYLWTTDDIASASKNEKHKRRGIAGSFAVFKVAGAAAQEGANLAEVFRIATKANESVRTYGVGFSGCTLPGSDSTLFSVPKGMMELGLGIHGEPGISEGVIPTAEELAKILVQGVLDELKDSQIKRIAVILNGLGATKYEELFVLWNSVSKELKEVGYEIVQPEVGEIVTSLEMAGCSLSIMLLDAELERLWNAPADTPAYKKSPELTTPNAKRIYRHTENMQTDKSQLVASEFSQRSASQISDIFGELLSMLTSVEGELGKIDAIAGDGDHGRGMVKGAKAAYEASQSIVARGGGLSSLFNAIGNSWAEKAGGTSGVLWGAALGSAAKNLDDNALDISPSQIINLFNQGLKTIQDLGKASLGDKTMLDAMQPFCESLSNEYQKGLSLKSAWSIASEVAEKAAKETANLIPKIGRARPLAERSLGHPDAGAVSFAMMVSTINKAL